MRQLLPPSQVPFDPVMETAGKTALALHKRIKDLNTEWHRHSKGQLLYAEEGVTRLYTTGGSFLLPPRHCAWIPPLQVHLVTSSSPSLFLRTLYFEVPASLNAAFYQQLSIFRVNNLLREMIVYTERWAKTEQANPEETAFMLALLRILPDLGQTALGLKLPASEHPKIKILIQYLLNHLAEKLSIVDLARQHALSTRTISRLFQRELGMPVVSFLKVARALKAVELLSLPGANVSETAYQVGYESVPSFSNSFFEIVGTRPQAFLVG